MNKIRHYKFNRFRPTFKRFKGGGGGTVVQQPAAPAYKQSPEERELLKLQAEQMRITMPGVSQYVSEIMPMEQERAKKRFDFTRPILEGGTLPGQYDIFGQELGTGEVEGQMFKDMSDRTQAEMNKLGLLESGVTAKLLDRGSQRIAMDTASRRRSELSNLINLAMGVPMTAGPMAQNAAGQNIQSIQGAGQDARNYALQGRPSYMNSPGGSGGSGQQAGQVVGGVLMSKMFFGCLPKQSLVTLENGKYELIENIVVGDKLKGGEVLKVKRNPVHPSFKWYLFKTESGELFASIDHFLKEKVLGIKYANYIHSDYGYDLLTTTGSFWVNNVEVFCEKKICKGV